MFLSLLGLQHFRNHARTRLEFGPGMTVFHGENGQGKSNLLEAVYFLATTRSARAGADRELVNWDERAEAIPFSRLEAHVQRAEGDLHVEVLLRLGVYSGRGD